MANEQWWGRPLPADVDVGVGARVILTDTLSLDYVADRRSWRGELGEDFSRWLATVAIPKLQRYVREHPELRLAVDTGVYVDESADGRYRLEAASNRSCGYLYTAAWIKPLAAVV